MVIECPSCGFRRNVPDSAMSPGKKYRITCPKCKESFSFSMPGGESAISAPEVAPQAQESRAPEQKPAPPAGEVRQEGKPVQEPQPEQQQPAPAAAEQPPVPDEKDGDDPLPPGAQVLDDLEPPRTVEAEPDDPQRDMQEQPARQGLFGFIQGLAQRFDTGGEAESGARSGVPQGAPWEQPEHYGFLNSFTKTLLGVMFHPREFFGNVRCNMPLIRPALFFVLMTLYEVLCSRIWLMKSLREMAVQVTDPQKLALAENLMNSLDNVPLALVITPFFALAQVFFIAGIYHLMFRIVQPGKADFATTLRIVCYSSAPYVLTIVPIMGSNIASVWFIVSLFLGCKYALGIPWTRTLLAMLPLFLLHIALGLHIAVFLSS